MLAEAAYLLLLLLGAAGAASISEIPAVGAADLSCRRLNGTVQLMVQPAGAARVMLSLLNVSGNPGLDRLEVTGPLEVMQVDVLDLSGTSVTPTDQLIHFIQPQNVLLSVRHVFINWTARPERPLQFAAFADLLYRLRAQSFAVSNWTVADFDANFSQADNACQSKKFDSVALRRAGLERIVGASVSATRSVDFRHNRIRLVANVTFHSGSVDLSHNRLSEIVNVSFQPGNFCRTLITGPPEARLNDNAITMATLTTFPATAQTMILSGLDLSRNPLVSGAPPPPPPPLLPRIRVVDWLRLGSVVTADVREVERRLADLLGRFFEPAGPGPVSLDLSGNRLGSLAAASRVLVMAGLSTGRLSELRLANSPFADHLNFSELAPPLGRLELGDLAGSRVRSVSAAVPLEALRRRRDGLDGASSTEPDFDLLQAGWRGTVGVLPRPGGCCAAQDTNQLFCFLHPDEHLEYRLLVCGGVGGTTDAGGDTGGGPGTQPLLVALSLVVAALAAVAIAVAFACARRRRLRRRRRHLRRRAADIDGDPLRPVTTKAPDADVPNDDGGRGRATA